MKTFAVFFLLPWVCGCRTEPVLRALAVHPARVEATVTTISSGTVSAQNQAVLAFGAAGRIASVAAKLGDQVKLGQTIAELENRDLYVTWQDSLKEYRRAEQLFQSGLNSRVAFDDAKRAVEVARVNYDRSVIRAPFDGMITEMNLDLGAETGPSAAKPPVRLIDLQPRIVKGDIDEVDLGKVKLGQPARVHIPAVRVQSFEATVSNVVPFVDTTKEQDRTSQIELKMSPTEVPIPVGASAEIEIITDVKENALALPSKVILGSGEQRYAYRFIQGKLVKTPLTLGIGNYDRTEVLSGLSAGEVVVFPSDDVELSDGMKVKVETSPWP